MLKKTLNAYHNRAIATQEVIEELIKLAKQMSAATQRGVDLGLTDDEVAFYDALAANDGAVEAMGKDELKVIAAELVTQVRKSVTIDWTLRESARAKIKVMVKRILRKHGYRLPRGPAWSGFAPRFAQSMSVGPRLSSIHHHPEIHAGGERRAVTRVKERPGFPRSGVIEAPQHHRHRR